MIISRAPYRVSFFGGGSDYDAFYSRYGGAVLSMTIDKYCHVLLRKMPPFLGTKYRIFWSEAEAVDTIEEIRHPGVRGCLQYLGIEDGIEVNHAGDLPARSGLGSSSAFTVAMLAGLHALRDDKIGRADIAREAVEVEQHVLKETVGIQDQIACAWGGFNVIKIDKYGQYDVRPIYETILTDWLVICFTGLQRNATDIAAEQVKDIERNTDRIKRIVDLVPLAVEAIKDPETFGRLLHEAWMLKRGLSSKVTNDTIDDIYYKAQKSGAIGGKLLGAGSGGFMVFCVPPERRQGMIKAMNNISTSLITIPVKASHGGVEIVHKT